MVNSGIAITYGDIAPGAKESFTPNTSDSKFDTLSQLQANNLSFQNYNNPCEDYAVLLDGKTELLPKNINGINIGLVSESLSNSDGTFTTPIVLTLTSDGQYTSSGLTLTFDTFNEIYATSVNIEWIRVTATTEISLGTETYSPDNAVYFCENPEIYDVSNFNKLIITFNSINMPKNRLRLRVIDYGKGIVFYGNELRSVRLLQKIDPISSEICINTADFIIDGKSENEYNFQTKQPFGVYFNGVLRATTFVKTSRRTSKFLWEVNSEDYIGLMDSIPYAGGMYFDISVTSLLDDIFGTAGVPYTIDNLYSESTITGYIPYTTCREALMQVAIAICAIVDTSNSDTVNVFPLTTSEIIQTIPLERIMQGQSFDNSDIVTSVQVMSHTYKPILEEVIAYNAADSGSGNNIFVRFSEPLHDLSISSAGTNEILSSGTNYAIIKAVTNNCVLTGQKYKHTTVLHAQENTILPAGVKENVKLIERATLINPNNIDIVLSNCFNWLIKTQTTNLRIIEEKHIKDNSYVKYGQKKYGTFKYFEPITPTFEPITPIIIQDAPVNVGDTIKAETEYLGEAVEIEGETHHYVQGIIISQSYNLNGNNIIKESVMK